MQTREEKVQIPVREEILGRVQLDDAGKITDVSLRVIGGPDLLAVATAWRPRWRDCVGQDLSALIVPAGVSTPEILLRELALKLKGEWNYPFSGDEVCHCRVVSCETIDRAIVVGAHTPKKVSDWTSASTACGTCRPDVEAMISYRLGR